MAGVADIACCRLRCIAARANRQGGEGRPGPRADAAALATADVAGWLDQNDERIVHETLRLDEASIASQLARRTLSRVRSSPVSRMTFR